MEPYQNIFIKDISNYRSAIMGFAMLSIMCFHQPFTNAFPFNFFHNFGFGGVDIFLFLSGMGLVNSLKNNSIKTFFKRRFNRLIPSCVVCGTAKYIILILCSSYALVFTGNFSMIIWTFVSLYSWFVFTIIILYIISPILHLLLSKAPRLTILCIIIVFFTNDLMIKPIIGDDWKSLFGIISWTIERLPVFTLGMFIAITNCDIDRRLYLSYISLFIAVIIKTLDIYNCHFIAQQSLTFLSLAIGIPSLITLILQIIKSLPLYLLRLFNFLGSYSFEIYIFDAFYFRDLKIGLELSSPWHYLPLYFILTCMSAYLSKQLVNKLPKLR